MMPKLRPTDPARVRGIVDDARMFSFGDPERIHAWAALFCEAHAAAPCGLSLEIGTWKGGSAVVFLGLLEELYHARHRPMLFTVDPYGLKPYDGGNWPEKQALYGNPEAVAMKSLLAPYANHAHWQLPSEDFLPGFLGKWYWWQGRHQQIAQLTFVLLDAEHDAASIERDLRLVLPWMHPQGRIVIDNVDNDPRTERMLHSLGYPLHVHRAALADERWVDLRPMASQRIAEALA